MAEENSEMIQNLLNLANSLQERISSLEEEVSQLVTKPTPRPPAARPAKAVAVTRPAMPSRSRKRPVSRPTVTYRVDPRSSGDTSRSNGGTQSIFGLLGGEKGHRILSALINQIKYAREDLIKRVNSQYKDVPGVPLEDT